VVDEVFDLLVGLGANDEQLDFPVIFASAKNGTATRSLDQTQADLRPLLEAILEHAPAPVVDSDSPLQFQAVTLGYDEYIGRLVIGRVMRGKLVRGATLVRVPKSGVPQSFRLTKLFGARGLERVELDVAHAGDIAVIAGIDTIEIGDTVCEPGTPEPLERIEVDPPTVRVRFSVNNSPFSGQEGRFVTSRQIGERLTREALGNVSIRLENSELRDTFVVAGRGELLIAVLIETLRREGYEFSVSRPEIIQREIDGKNCEPVEDVVIEVPESYAGVVMEKLGSRKGRMISMEHRENCVRFLFTVPSRGLFGYRSEFLSDTRGDGVLYRTVSGYEPWAGELSHRGVGAVVSTSQGKTTPYSLYHIQERASLFVKSGVPVYEGQIIGETRRPRDMSVNAVRPKKLTNVRAAGKDEATVLTPAKAIGIEWALEWMEDDELLEVTPQSLRLRKRILQANLRKRA
jgi:GTP-binding protein